MRYKNILLRFPFEEACCSYLLRIYHPTRLKCPRCHSIRICRRSDNIRKFNCALCRSTFSGFRESMMKNSRTDLRKWFYIICIMLACKKRSVASLSRELGVTYKTAWRMASHVKKSLKSSEGMKFRRKTVLKGMILLALDS